MSPKSFLSLAGRLAREAKAPGNPDGSEAECRTAIGRAYYSAFLEAREFVVGLGFRVAEGGACHNDVQLATNNCGNASLAKVSTHLRTLYQSRSVADYALHNLSGVDVGQAELMIQVAEEVFQLLNSLPNTTPSFDPRDLTFAIEQFIAATRPAGLSKK